MSARARYRPWFASRNPQRFADLMERQRRESTPGPERQSAFTDFYRAWLRERLLTGCRFYWPTLANADRLREVMDQCDREMIGR